MKKYIQLLVVMGVIIFSSFSFTKEKRARSYDSFYDQLAKSPYSIALLYDKSKEAMRDKQVKEQIQELELMFRSLSKDPEYKDADLLFLTADVARRDLNTVARGLRVTQFPTVQLFVGRQPLAGARIQGAIERAQLDNLINRFLRKKIDEYLKDKDAARKRELERAQIRAYSRAYYWGPYGYYGYGYPYWGYGGWGYGARFGYGW